MKINRGLITFLLIIGLVLGFIIFGGECDGLEPKKVEDSVQEAAEYIQENGRDNLEIFNKKNNKFTTNNNYIYLIDFKTMKMLVHPIKPELEGRDMSNMKDTKGNYFILEMITKSAEYPRVGYWVKYWWPKPGGEEPSEKFVYCRRVLEKEILVASGIYNDNLNVEKLNFYLRNKHGK